MKYVAPEMKVVMFETEDVVVASGMVVVPTEEITYDEPDQTFF